MLFSSLIRFILFQFSRQYTLPSSCDPLRVYSNLSRDGVLVITAPKRTSGTSTTSERSVPITGSTYGIPPRKTAFDYDLPSSTGRKTGFEYEGPTRRTNYSATLEDGPRRKTYTRTVDLGDGPKTYTSSMNKTERTVPVRGKY